MLRFYESENRLCFDDLTQVLQANTTTTMYCFQLIPDKQTKIRNEHISEDTIFDNFYLESFIIDMYKKKYNDDLIDVYNDIKKVFIYNNAFINNFTLLDSFLKTLKKNSVEIIEQKSTKFYPMSIIFQNLKSVQKSNTIKLDTVFDTKEADEKTMAQLKLELNTMKKYRNQYKQAYLDLVTELNSFMVKKIEPQIFD